MSRRHPRRRIAYVASTSADSRSARRHRSFLARNASGRAYATHVRRIACGLVVLGGVVLAATAEQAPEPLLDGQLIAAELPADGERTFTLLASAGDAVRVRIDQRGVDVIVAVIAADGRLVVETNTSDRLFGTETAAFVAADTGHYRVAVRPVFRSTPGGRVEVRLVDRRAATARHHAFVAAMRAFDAAIALGVTTKAAPTAERHTAVIRAFDNVRQLFEAAGDDWGTARALLEYSVASIRVQQWDAVEAPLRRALALWESLDDPFTTAAALNIEGMRLSVAGRPVEAAATTGRALEFARAAGDLATASLAANNLGIMVDTLGDAEQAYDLFREALALRQRAGRGIGESSVLINLARLAGNIGDVDTAAANYRRALALATAENEQSAARVAANNLGNLLRRVGDVEGALDWHRTYLRWSREQGSVAGESQALNGIGTDLFELGRHDEAEALQRQSLALRRQTSDTTGVAATLQSLGETLTALGRHDEALAALRESLQIRERAEDVRALPGVWRTIAETQQARGQFDQALAAIHTSLSLVEQLRDKLTAPALRASFVAREHTTYELKVELLMQAFRQNNDATLEQRAFEAADRARARVLIDALWSSRVDIREGVSPELLRVERELQQRVARESTALSRILAANGADTRAAAAREALTEASRELEHHQSKLLRESPAYAALVRPEPVPLDTVQRELLDESTILLEYAIGATRSWLFVVSRDSFESHELPGRGHLEQSVRALRAFYEARVPVPGDSTARAAARVARADAAIPAAAAALSAMLLEPVAGRLAGTWRSKRLAIVASEALEYLSMAALPAPGSRRPLVDSHEIVYLPSASALGAVRRRAGPARRPDTPRLAIVADPVFEATDPRLPRQQRPAAAAPALGGPLARAVRGRASGAPSEGRLTRLTFSRLEASAISRLLPASQVRMATGFAASRDALTTEALGVADIVHLATHGLVSTSQPALTGLVVSLLDARGRPRDGFVRLSDVYNLRLNADLVVLSACHTALGAEVRGEGLVGLTRGFMYAGARRVVASLWAVDDSATAELMSHFYRGMLHDKLPPAAALRAAQRELARRPQWAAPYYWAGFVLQGDWQ